jgi:Tfp pilus assembly protein PilW
VTATLRRRLKTGQPGDAGLTLVELLTTMIIVSLITGIMVTAISVTTRTSQASTSRQIETTQAQTVIDRVTHYLRAAYLFGSPSTAFTYAGDTEATFASDTGDANGPVLVDVKLTGTTLTESVTKADPNSSYTWTGTPTVRTDSYDVTSNPVFVYYDSSGNRLSTPMTTASQTSKIAAVRINLTETEAGVSDPISLSDYVLLRNAEYH